MFILIDENKLKYYIDYALKYKALLDYGVTNWCSYYDALDEFKNEEYDLENDDYSIIEDFSKLVDKEINYLNYCKLEESN